MTRKPPQVPSPMQAALLVLQLAQAKEQKRFADATREEHKVLTRFRLSETTLKRLCDRQRIPPEYLAEVQEWLMRAGWALFYTDTSYAMIKSSSVDSWTRLSWKRIQPELEQVSRGEFEFQNLYHLLQWETSAAED